jgi:tRNA modification GTPase
METRTIVALSSARGTGAIAVVRISGIRAFEIIEKCVEPKAMFKNCSPQQLRLYTFRSPSNGKTVDQITAVKFISPNSYTGEDMVELFCHGGEFIVDKILTILMDMGAELADRGEFTRKGFLNGKFDLIHAESILGLIEGRTKREHETSLEAYMGVASKMFVKWRREISRFLENLEVSLEFPDEDILNFYRDFKRIIKTRKEIEQELEKRKKTRLIEKGIIIPIVGIANAGKSSLFNLLLGYERAIVHWKEGTTRDSIGEEIEIASDRIVILDTAGLRETDEDVEKLGIKKTQEYINRAAMVIMVTPADVEVTKAEERILRKFGGHNIAVIISKKDCANALEKEKAFHAKKIPALSCSLLATRDRDRIMKFIEKIYKTEIGTVETSNVLFTKRHEIIAGKIVKELKQLEKSSGLGEEIIALGLNKTLALFAEIIGETTSDEILNNIFSRFCIGK